MVRLGDFRLQLHRFEKILHARRRDGMEADENWDRTASVGMANVQKPHRHHTTRPSNRRQLHTMLPEPRPHDNGRHTDLSRVQSAYFNPVLARSIKYVLWHRLRSEQAHHKTNDFEQSNYKQAETVC